MSIKRIQVGGFYVNDNKGFVREVVEEYENGDVLWRDFVLPSGKPIAGGRCLKHTLSQWANREATPEEVSRLQRTEAILKENMRAAQMVDTLLQSLPDDMLLAEVRRRGLKLNE